ncbi:TylF/MycF/NovP-related O-methyltransferase [Candidatus Chlamydia sanziniae]|uniref:Phage protein n=1 Tax=Candidatus Chlamydia sanziniae TaxID=1806891 RepID=A0A1A9HXN7_9CHLA|nr:TylF/MycF/NovP-related O-methyltransferase [Candidatus Chlamydia sanziniae]ANH78852.1 Phage protein [Candidatus Chlamydia sanziniae]
MLIHKILFLLLYGFTYQTALCSVEQVDLVQLLQINIPFAASPQPGHQLYHFASGDKPYENSETAKIFVKQYLSNAVPLLSDVEVLRYGSDSVELKGLYIDLGVCTGRSANFLAALNPHQTIFGFDSFEGLPEPWVRKDKTFIAGTFAFGNPNLLPPVLHNVKLIKGWFKDTLINFAQTVDPKEKVAFLHIDCELYSSSVTAFEAFGSRICPGTIIVFDEFYNFPGYESHEFKAFQEFLNKTGLGAQYLAYNANHEQVAIKIIEKSWDKRLKVCPYCLTEGK